MNTTPEQLQNIIEAAVMVAGRPLPIAHIQKLFDENAAPSVQEIRAAIDALNQRYENTAIELREVASGYQFQAKSDYAPWLARLWEERPPRYSRAFLETLALIAYRQPITRAEVEEIRGVAVNSAIIKTLMEREWIRIIGYKDVPGKPALLGTTKAFLDHFNLKSLDELPTLSELKDLDSQEAKLQIELELSHSEEATQETAPEAVKEIAEEIAQETAKEMTAEIVEETVEEITEEITAETTEETETPLEQPDKVNE